MGTGLETVQVPSRSAKRTVPNVRMRFTRLVCFKRVEPLVCAFDIVMVYRPEVCVQLSQTSFSSSPAGRHNGTPFIPSPGCFYYINTFVTLFLSLRKLFPRIVCCASHHRRCREKRLILENNYGMTSGAARCNLMGNDPSPPVHHLTRTAVFLPPPTIGQVHGRTKREKEEFSWLHTRS